MPNEVTQAATEEAAKTFTQEQVNEIVKERLARAKADVPADYEELKAKAARLDELEEAGKSELEKLSEQYAKLQSDHERLVRANEVRAWAAEVSAETGVPASILRGGTKEEIEDHAKAILGSGLSHYGSAPDNGEANGVDTVTAESIWAIADPVKRIEAISRNLDKFK